MTSRRPQPTPDPRAPMPINLAPHVERTLAHWIEILTIDLDTVRDETVPHALPNPCTVCGAPASALCRRMLYQTRRTHHLRLTRLTSFQNVLRTGMNIDSLFRSLVMDTARAQQVLGEEEALHCLQVACRDERCEAPVGVACVSPLVAGDYHVARTLDASHYWDQLTEFLDRPAWRAAGVAPPV